MSDGTHDQFMKKLIAKILLICSILMVRADTVGFSWRANTEPDLLEYRLYANNVWIASFTGTTGELSGVDAGTYFSLTAVNTAGIESLPTDPPLLYRGRAVEISGWRDGVEVFCSVFYVNRSDVHNFFRLEMQSGVVIIQRASSLGAEWREVASVVVPESDGFQQFQIQIAR